eukprot:scaffold313942_cov28-Tisochrysis_lutea.AAC.1
MPMPHICLCLCLRPTLNQSRPFSARCCHAKAKAKAIRPKTFDIHNPTPPQSSKLKAHTTPWIGRSATSAPRSTMSDEGAREQERATLSLVTL